MTDYSGIEQKEEDLKKEDEGSEETKPEQKVLVTKYKKKKKGLVERLTLAMLGPDGIPGITSYLGEEIVKPAIKNIVVDSITSGIHMAVFGGQSHDRPNSSARPGGYSNNQYNQPRPPRTNYTKSYSSTPTYNREPEPRMAKRERMGRNDFAEEIVIEDRHEAVDVLDALTEQIIAYGSISVADYYDMIGVEAAYTDNQYGWVGDDLRTASIAPTRGGYVLRLPRVNRL